MLMITNQDLRSGAVIHAKEQSIIATGIYKNSVEHKYSYCGIMYRLPAYGWSSTKDHIGVYFINPTTEYIGGGAEKMDLVCHLDATPAGLLDFRPLCRRRGLQHSRRRGLEEGRRPDLRLFQRAGKSQGRRRQAELDTLAATQGNPTVPASWHDNAFALGTTRWPRPKRSRPPGPLTGSTAWTIRTKTERGNVTGQFVLNDPQAATTKLPDLTVGLAHPDYTGTGRRIHAAVGQRQPRHLAA